jgi:hypothetical protein
MPRLTRQLERQEKARVSSFYSCKASKLIVSIASRLTDARREAANALAGSLGKAPDTRVECSFAPCSADAVHVSLNMSMEAEGLVKVMVCTLSFGEPDDDVLEATGRTGEWLQQQLARIYQDGLIAVVVRCSLEVSSPDLPKDAPQSGPLVLGGQAFVLSGADYAPVTPDARGVTRLRWWREPEASVYNVEVHYTHERVGPSLAADLWASETAYAARFAEELFQARAST